MLAFSLPISGRGLAGTLAEQTCLGVLNIVLLASCCGDMTTARADSHCWFSMGPSKEGCISVAMGGIARCSGCPVIAQRLFDNRALCLIETHRGWPID